MSLPKLKVSSDIVFSVSVAHDHTAQIGKSFNFVHVQLADKYWDKRMLGDPQKFWGKKEKIKMLYFMDVN